MSIAAIVPGRATDLADLDPVACWFCPEKAVRAATFAVEWTTVDCAIGGAERRELACDVCIGDALRFAAEMNIGITPPVVSALDSSVPAQRGAA